MVIRYRYVPTTLPEVKDYIGAMVIAVPDLVDNIADGGVDGAYDTLVEGLEQIRKKLGEELHSKLFKMAQASRACIADGDEKQGRVLLQLMDEAMSQKRRVH